MSEDDNVVDEIAEVVAKFGGLIIDLDLPAETIQMISDALIAYGDRKDPTILSELLDKLPESIREQVLMNVHVIDRVQEEVQKQKNETLN